MSHQNGLDQHRNLTAGNDHRIIARLMQLLRESGVTDDVFTLSGLYDCAQSKAIIRQFDMLVSGRIHGAVSGLSQHIPTVIVEYGHEPKAHKLRGFAQLVGIEEYVAAPSSSDDMIAKIDACWSNRDVIRQRLLSRIREVKELAKENFRHAAEVINTDTRSD